MSEAITDGPRDGVTFDLERDGWRLNMQATDVWRCIKDGEWYTLADIATFTGHPEASVSARLRDFRKARFGGLTIERRYVKSWLWHAGQWEYRYVRGGA